MSTIAELKAEATKALQTKQYELAVELFGEACGAYATEHEGQEDPDLLFEYGNALFQLGRSNASLLNTENVDSTSRPMEKEHDPSRIELAPMDELEVVPEGEKSSKELAQEQKAELEAAKTVEAEAEADGEADGEADPEADPEAGGEAPEEEVDDFTAAWQMIDLCRVLYTRELEIAKEKTPINRKLADVYALLGEISIEDDNYDQAAEDYASALDIKQQILEPTDRLLSEAHYMLALALEMKGDSDKEAALEHMQSAVDVAKKSGVDNQSIQDLRQKVHDLKKEVDSIKNNPSSSSDGAPLDREAALKGMMDMLGNAQDIGGLVKRKIDPKSVEQVKKAKLDEK